MKKDEKALKDYNAQRMVDDYKRMPDDDHTGVTREEMRARITELEREMARIRELLKSAVGVSG